MASSISIPLLIALGAVLGAISRYRLTSICTQRWGTHFPYGTLLVNLSGTVGMGFFASILRSSLERTYLIPLIMTGFLGAYTTFSTYTLESSNLFRSGRPKKALLYWIGSPILGLIGIEIGMLLGGTFSAILIS